jgi:tetratricopeptide (TPR) repeat protein
MRIRLVGAAFAAGLVASFVAATPARADIVRLRDGKVLPAGAVVPKDGVPSQEEMEKHKGKKLEPMGYDGAKLGGVEVPPGMIDEVWTWDTWESQLFQEAERSAAGTRFAEAADLYLRAAEELRGGGKQVALGKRAIVLALANDADGMIAAIDELKAEFPKTVFLTQLEKRRASVLAGRDQRPQAVDALDKVIGAAGINKHDLYEAKLFKIFLTQYVPAGRDRAKWAEAEKSYRELLTAVEGEAAAKSEVEDSRLRALVGIGRSLVFQGKQADARKFLDQVVAGATNATDASLLGSAYVGLGDVMFAEARETQAKAAGNEALKKQALDQLESALLHYLRVTELYYERTEQSDLYQARIGAGRVFAAIFGASNDKDCDAALKAQQFMRAAHDMLPNGVEKSQLVREFNEFKQRRDKACK